MISADAHSLFRPDAQGPHELLAPEQLKPERFRGLLDDGSFRADWFTHNIPAIATCIDGLTIGRVLEIGSYEGMSTIWFSYLAGGLDVTCIDTFEGSSEHDDWLSTNIEGTFDRNIGALASPASRVRKLKGLSKDRLRELGRDSEVFDLIYVDGSHRADDVYVDASLSWDLLRAGGVMIFDDYLWSGGSSETERPLTGVNRFLNRTRGQYDVVWAGYAIGISKRRRSH